MREDDNFRSKTLHRGLGTNLVVFNGGCVQAAVQRQLVGDDGDFLLQGQDVVNKVPAAWFLGDGHDVDRTQKHKHTHESWPLPLHGTGGKTIICVTLSSAVCCPTTHYNIFNKSITAVRKQTPPEASTPRPSDTTLMA